MGAEQETKMSWLERPLFANIKLNWETVIFASVLILAVVSRFYDLGLRVMSHDESLHTYFSWLLSRGGTFEHTPLMHGPLQFILLALSYFLFGASDFTARIPAALASIATIAFLWNYRRYLGKSGMLVAAGLFLISPFMLYYGRYTRNEAFVALFGVVTTWAILRYLDTGENRYLLWLTAATALHFTTKETSFIYTAQALLFLLGLFLYRLYKRPWGRAAYRKLFSWGLLMALLLFIAAAGSLQFADQISTLGGTETLTPLVPGAQAELPEEENGDLPILTIVFASLGSITIVGAVFIMFIGLPKSRTDSSNTQTLILSGIGLTMVSILIGVLARTEQQNRILEQYFASGIPATAGSFIDRILNWLTAPTLYFPLLAIIFGLLAMLAGYYLTRSIYLYMPVLRQLRSLDLIMLLGVMVLPHLSALAINAVGWEMGDYNSLQMIQFVQIAIILIPVGLLSVGIGYAWKGKEWLKNAAVFYAIFALFYTTVFTHGAGFFSGMVSSLGDWLEQQGVERGSQPDYYYVLVQVPVYEYLAAAAALLAAVLGIRWLMHRSSDKNVEKETDSSKDIVEIDEHEPELFSHSQSRRVALIFLAFWVVTSFVGYSAAGEKMPWLTVHLALPMLLLGGWALGRMINKIDINTFKQRRGMIAILITPVFITSLLAGVTSLLGPVPPFQGSELAQLKVTSTFLFSFIAVIGSGLGLRYVFMNWESSQVVSLITMTVFGLLALMTIKTSIAASYINQDRATEYLVYAHSARSVKDVMAQVEEISIRLTGGLDLEIGYDDDVSWPFSWYLRDYTKARLINDFGPEVRNIPVMIIGNDHWGDIGPLVERNYYQFEYIRMWWPNQDYYNMTTERIINFATDPGLRSGLMQIWLNRDYSQYAFATGNTNNSFSLENWSPSDRMRLYIRKDIVAQIWDYGVSPIPDPYEDNVLGITAQKVLGAQGVGPGEFNGPRDIAIAPDGSLYVADSFNSRIQHLTPDGELINEWGISSNVTADNPPDQVTFIEPWGIALSPDGEFVYVADTWNNRIQKFTADGEYVLEWGQPAQGTITDFGFYGPRDVAVDADGNVYVADTGNKRIAVYTENGEFITSIGGFGLGLGQFDEPVGIAIDSNSGLIYVADTWNQRVQVIQKNADGSYVAISEWDIAGWDGQGIDNKPFIAVDGDGNVYITDPEIARVIVFSSTGEYLRSWSALSELPGDGLINGIAIDENGGVWISDGRKHVLYYFVLP